MEWGRNGVFFSKQGKSLNFEIYFIQSSFCHFTSKSQLSHYHSIHLSVISVIRPHPLKHREGFGFWTGAGMSECLKNAPEWGRNERIRCCLFIRDSTRFVHSEVIPVHLGVIQWRFKSILPSNDTELAEWLENGPNEVGVNESGAVSSKETTSDSFIPRSFLFIPMSFHWEFPKLTQLALYSLCRLWTNESGAVSL